MKEMLRALVNHFPRLKTLLKRFVQMTFPSRWASARYVEMKDAETDSESARLRAAWKSEDLPGRQRELVERQLVGYRRGVSIDVFDVLAGALKNLQDIKTPLSVLEVGCSSGYYSEVFDIAGLPVAYTGCDYSDAFVALAREKYPQLQFDVQDATALDYDEGTFEVVISGCCLLHIPEYEIAITEAARVARSYVIFHRTPILLGQPNKYYRKLAYGLETVEIHFNESQFLQSLMNNGLELVATHTLNETISNGVGSATRTYVCRKKVI